VIVQAPQTATCPGMPNSAIASDCADLVLPPWRIGDAITTLAMVPGAASRGPMYSFMPSLNATYNFGLSSIS
jgi:CheB methylesterase